MTKVRDPVGENWKAQSVVQVSVLLRECVGGRVVTAFRLRSLGDC